MDVKDRYTVAFLKAVNITPTENSLKEYKSIWWLNFRNKNEGGLRLTEQGLEFITAKAEIKSYFIEFPKGLAITPQVLIWLDNFIKSPYFINKKGITVLSEKTAFELYLFSGDVKKMGASKALAKLLAQESSDD
jgi:hypothetical protein